jgi:hypothetical protein
LRRDLKRPRDLIYLIGGLALLTYAVWGIWDDFTTERFYPFIIWSCGGSLLLTWLDKRSDRESSTS